MFVLTLVRTPLFNSCYVIGKFSMIYHTEELGNLLHKYEGIQKEFSYLAYPKIEFLDTIIYSSSLTKVSKSNSSAIR
jgi:hypothetical protein